MKTLIDVLEEKDVRGISSFSLNTTYSLADPRFGVSTDCEVCRREKCDGHYAMLDIGTYIVHPRQVTGYLNQRPHHCRDRHSSTSVC